MSDSVSRRDALRKLGLAATAAFVLPTVATVSQAEAGGKKKGHRGGKGKGGSGGSGGSGGKGGASS